MLKPFTLVQSVRPCLLSVKCLSKKEAQFIYLRPEIIYMDQCDIQIFKPYNYWFYCQAHWGLPVGFLLLPFSVICTVESLSLFYLEDNSWIS